MYSVFRFTAEDRGLAQPCTITTASAGPSSRPLRGCARCSEHSSVCNANQFRERPPVPRMQSASARADGDGIRNGNATADMMTEGITTEPHIWIFQVFALWRA